MRVLFLYIGLVCFYNFVLILGTREGQILCFKSGQGLTNSAAECTKIEVFLHVQQMIFVK